MKLAIASVVAVAASAAQADILVFNFGLDGTQEVPAVTTGGIGSATVTLDTVTFDVTVNGTFSGLTGNTTAAHIHGLAAPGTNAGVIIGLTIPGGVTSGTITGAGTLTAAQAQGMIDGLTYINVHSSFAPGGEIRGQITPAPTSGLVLGMGALAMARRRRG